jgi:hypothetical protein
MGDQHAHPTPAAAHGAAVHSGADAAAANGTTALLRYLDQLNAYQQSQQQALMKMLQQQASSAPAMAQQMLGLASLGALPSFAGQADASGMAAREWLQKVEHYFTMRETTLGVDAAHGDAFRVHSARAALTGDALRWLMALPSPPATWQEFKTVFSERFSSVPAAQVREQQLRQFVSTAHRLRDKLNVEGLQRYTTLFLQRAGEIPTSRMTDATKRHLYSQGLPTRYAEVVLTEDAKAQPMALHEVAQHVLAKATLKAYAGAGAGSGEQSARRDGDAMDVDAIALCAMQFGVSRDEAAAYCVVGESCSGGTASAGAAAAPSQAGSDRELLTQLLAAITSPRFHKGASNSRGGKSTGAPAEGALKDIPEDLIAARKKANLCAKCGVVRYERGAKGHNARTCKASPDKTTSVADGLKRAEGKQNF